MSLFSQLEAQLREATLRRDSATSEVLKLVKSALLLQAKEAGVAVPDDEACRNCIYKQIKIYEEAAELFRSQNERERADQKERELEILQNLLPTQLGQAELERVVEDAIRETDLEPEMSNFKALLEAVAAKVGPTASRDRIARALKDRIGSGNA